MANIKKSFNFRNGVQVDDDNLKVSATGLVGIGTTVPTEALDVRGNLVVSGVSSAVTLQAGIATITTLNPTEIIGAGVSIKSGIVTASSGIITYFGDGINLLNLPTSQWEDTIVGAGVSSIYNTGGNVGIATTAALFTLQVGNDVNSGQKGVGISSFGDIKASGITTASGFVGPLTGDVTGNVTGNLTGNVTGNVTGNLSGDVTGNTQGIHNGAVNLGTNESLKVGTAITVTDVGTRVDITKNKNVFHIQELTSGSNLESWGSVVDAGGTLVIVPQFRLHRNGPVELYHQNGFKKLSTSGVGVTISSQLDTTNLNIAGVSTFFGRIEGAATNNVIPFLYNNYSDLPSAGTYHGAFAHVHSFGKAYYAHAGAWFELVNKEADGRVGTGTETYNVGNIVSSGIITATTVLNSPQIGVGTDAPANEIQVRKSGNTEIQVTSDTGIAGITVGRETGTNDTNNAELRFGGGTGFPYSSSTSFDLINYDTGNFNYHLSANNAGAVTGDFIWHKGKNNNRMMTLTNTGRLGIGVTQPTQALHVGGNGFVAGNFTVDDTVITNSLSVTGSASFNNLSSAQLTSNLIGNVNATSGLSTFFNIKVTDPNNNFAGIGIKTDNSSNLPFEFVGDSGDLSTRVIITNDGVIGLGTDLLHDTIDIVADTKKATFAAVGVGTTTPSSAVDMRYAGQNQTGASANRMYMYPPQVTTTQRGNLAGVAAGALIYNTNANTLQVYNDTTWISLGSAGLGDGFVNAADYGLDASKTDGTNVTAINNAIAALGTNGGTIFFPGGQFYLNAAIELTQAANENSLRFVGSGHQNYGGGSDAGGTVLRRDADDEFFNITNSRAIHFVGITFKGGAANGNGGNSGISGGNGAIYVLANAGCQGYLIENCVFHGIANCIHFKGLSDSIIRGCRFRNVPSNEGNGACIKLDENGSEVIDQIRIQDCVIDGSPDGSAINTAIDGIAIYNTVSTVYVTNTSAIRLRRSFYSDTNWDGNFFYFQNSEAERANEDGFSINGTGNFVTIDNCFSCTNGQGGTGHGINIGASQNSSLNITNPNVRDNSGHGILINGPTNNCSIVNPAIGGNSRGSTGTNHGIVIGTNANNVYISGGKIGGNTDELAGTGIQGRGILIDGATHSNIRIIGANVTGNQNAEGISQNISSGTGNSIQFNAGSTVAIDT